MVDNCATCFFFRTFNVIKRGTTVPVGVCARNAPLTGASGNQSATLWPEILDPNNWWCGDYLTSYPGGLVWTGYNCVFSPGSGSWTSISVIGDTKFAQLGKMIFFRASFGIINNGTGGTSIIFTLPTVPVWQQATYGITTAFGGSIPTKAIVGYTSSVTSQVVYTDVNGAYPGGNSVEIHVAGNYQTP